MLFRSQLTSGMKKFPNVLKNIRIAKKVDIKGNKALSLAVEEVEKELGSLGRVLIRASGTEPLIRVMVEGEELALVERCAERLSEVVKSEFL